MKKETATLAFVLKILKQIPLIICFAFLIFGNKLNLSVKEYEVLSYFITAMAICYAMIITKDIYTIIMTKILKK